MPAVNPSSLGGCKPQFELADGEPAVGAKLFWYVNGAVGAKQATYADSTGNVANPNPVVLNSLGMPPNEIWLVNGLAYSVVYAPATDSDPPQSAIFTVHGIRGINDSVAAFAGLGTMSTQDATAVAITGGTITGIAPDAHAASHQDGGSDELSVLGLSGLLADAQTPLGHVHAPADVTGTAVITTDPRLSDARTPLAHAVSHQNAGGDEISVAGLSGVLADPQPPIIGVGAAQAVAGNDARLTDARTPTAHATSHKSGGSDAIKLDELAAPTDVTTLNATTLVHGLMMKYPGGSTAYLREDGTFAVPAGAAEFATGVRIIFQQTAAPSGWTKQTGTAYNDAAIRLTTGTVSTGGTVTFTTHYNVTATASHTLTIGELASHTHAQDGNTGIVGGAPTSNLTGGATGSFGGTTQANGSNTSHTHNLNSMDIKFADAIVCAKN